MKHLLFLAASIQYIQQKKLCSFLKDLNLLIITVPSPGGPMAVHTTSFTQVTSVQLTMKSLDRNSFQLERVCLFATINIFYTSCNKTKSFVHLEIPELFFLITIVEKVKSLQELTFLLFIFNARDDLATFPPRNLGFIGCVNPFAHWKTKKIFI